MQNEQIRRLLIMDFDGTLMDTMTPDIGKPIWKEHMGSDWPHRGWWGRRESLDIEVFGCVPRQYVVDAYRQEETIPGTHKVMMTGRIPPLQNQVKAMLIHCDLVFDEYLFNNGGPTLDFKIKKLNEFTQRFPNLTDVKIYEDRPDHTKAFIAWGETVDMVVNVVQV